MTDEFKTPQPGDRTEMPNGWSMLSESGELHPVLTDERILAIAERLRNHTLTAQSGTKFDLIEHKDVVAFAREIERDVIRQQVVPAPKLSEMRWDIPVSCRRGHWHEGRHPYEVRTRARCSASRPPLRPRHQRRTITIDGLRYGKDIEPVTVPDVIRILIESGRKVPPMGALLFKLDSETVLLRDFFEAAWIAVGPDKTIALVM